jgi:hypothetical protein
VSGPGPLDDAVTPLLADLLAKHAIGARIVSYSETLPANIGRLDDKDVRFVAVCYLEPANFTNARYLVRRLKRRFPDAHLLLGFWGYGPDDTRYLEAVESTGCKLIATSLHETLERILFFASHANSGETEDRDGALVA